MAFDPEKVPLEHADLFYHGLSGPSGVPVGLTDAEYDAQKAEMIEQGTWPFEAPGYQPPGRHEHPPADA